MGDTAAVTPLELFFDLVFVFSLTPGHRLPRRRAEALWRSGAYGRGDVHRPVGLLDRRRIS
jgi:hypothetical protein